MTITQETHHASAIGPATREQLKQWAVEHDKTWDRKLIAGRIFVVVGGIGLVGLAAVALHYGLSGVSMWEGVEVGQRGWVIAIPVAMVCLLVNLGLWWLYYVRLVERRPVNPYRPTDLTASDLELQNADFPGALAYLDAIHHQHRPIVPHDLDVLATVRRQQQSSQGA